MLGLDLVAGSESLRLFDPVTGEWLRTPPEEAAARVLESAARAEAEWRASQDRAQGEGLEAEIARLRAQLDDMRKP